MKTNLLRNIAFKLGASVMLVAFSISLQAAEVVYRLVEYNKTTGEFVLAASGETPKDSWAYFESEYGATTGNRYNQIPRNRHATLYLEGWRGCKVKSVTLAMCSNSKSGQIGLSLSDGDTPLFTQHPVDFASDEWFGSWVSKDLNVYVDVTKKFDVPVLASDEACLTLQGGTSEGSVYISTITIEYEPSAGSDTESPLGWVYEKLGKKSVLHDGDEVILFRNGAAAADFGGMEQSHYLDAVAIASTADVTSHDVLRFRLDKQEEQDGWTLTDQYGRKLGASGKQSLAWDEGSTLWTIGLGYDGATVVNANSAYGTLRYNEPQGNYARFNVYASNSLPLPFLYRKDSQKEPELSRSLTLDELEMTVGLDAGFVSLHATLLPANTTDKRVVWTSSNEDVAIVNGGYVKLLGIGVADITARAKDSGAEASVHLTVTEPAGVASVMKSSNREKRVARKVANANGIAVYVDGKAYGVDGSCR